MGFDDGARLQIARAHLVRRRRQTRNGPRQQFRAAQRNQRARQRDHQRNGNRVARLRLDGRQDFGAVLARQHIPAQVCNSRRRRARRRLNRRATIKPRSQPRANDFDNLLRRIAEAAQRLRFRRARLTIPNQLVVRQPKLSIAGLAQTNVFQNLRQRLNRKRSPQNTLNRLPIRSVQGRRDIDGVGLTAFVKNRLTDIDRALPVVVCRLPPRFIRLIKIRCAICDRHVCAIAVRHKHFDIVWIRRAKTAQRIGRGIVQARRDQHIRVIVRRIRRAPDLVEARQLRLRGVRVVRVRFVRFFHFGQNRAVKRQHIQHARFLFQQAGDIARLRVG
ncbi:MAG: hypothetical protein HDKAJFGB_02795 [Anaerolineae bacterium]|nr:hypothetical protein [Anaerolineae bacterium]